LQQLRDGFQGIFQDTFSQYRDDEMPWILQFYVQDELSMSYLAEAVQDYILTKNAETEFSQSYLELIKKHCEWLSKPEGIFIDDKVTGSSYFGVQRKVRVVIYRQYSSKMALRRGRSSIDDLNQVATSFVSKLKGVGIKAERMCGHAFREWLIRWFNPKPKVAENNTDKLLAMIPSTNKKELPYGYDFAEQLFYSVLESNEKEGVWYFDQLPHRYIAIQRLSKVPELGQLTRERSFGNYRYGLFDKFPEGSTFVMTVVIQSQEIVKNHLDRIEDRVNASKFIQIT